MNDLERRALMGDRKAQKECAENGILLTCPWCRGEMEVCHGENYGNYKTKCVLCGAESPEQPNEWSAISRNNIRPAPPIGRCKDCDNWDKYIHAGRESLGTYVCVCHEWSDEENGYTRYTSPYGFCNNFEPREE